MKPKQKRSGINDHIKKSLYNWIINNPQVVKSSIFNDFLKVKIDGHTRPKLVPKLLLQVSIREHHNSLVIDTVDGGLKETIDVENNKIISDSTFHSILPPQLKKSSVIQGHVWLLMLYIYQNYTFLITIMA